MCELVGGGYGGLDEIEMKVRSWGEGGGRTLYIRHGNLCNSGMTSTSKAVVNQRVKASPSGPSSLRTLSVMRSDV